MHLLGGEPGWQPHFLVTALHLVIVKVEVGWVVMIISLMRGFPASRIALISRLRACGCV